MIKGFKYARLFDTVSHMFNLPELSFFCVEPGEIDYNCTVHLINRHWPHWKTRIPLVITKEYRWLYLDNMPSYFVYIQSYKINCPNFPIRVQLDLNLKTFRIRAYWLLSISHLRGRVQFESSKLCAFFFVSCSRVFSMFFVRNVNDFKNCDLMTKFGLNANMALTTATVSCVVN